MRKSACLILAVLACSYLSCKKEVSPQKQAEVETSIYGNLKETVACPSPPQFVGLVTTGSHRFNEGREIIIQPSGAVALVGLFGGTGDFDPGPRVRNLTALDNGVSVFSQRFDKSGKFMGAAIEEKGYRGDFLQDNEGNRYRMNQETVGDPWVDCGYKEYLLKYDPAGKLLWKTLFASFVLCYRGFEIQDFKLDSDNSVIINYIGGWYKITSSGELVDMGKKPNVGQCEFMLDSQNNIYTFVSEQYKWGFAKFNKNGKEWAVALDQYVKDITIDSKGNFYVLGVFGQTVDFDPGPGVYNMDPIGKIPNESIIYVSKFDAKRKFLWAKQLGLAIPHRIKLTVDEKHILVAGTMKGAPTFELLTGPVKFNLGEWDRKAFLMVLTQCE